MFRESDKEKLILPYYNPLFYFSHLDKRDQRFVLNEILPNLPPPSELSPFQIPCKLVEEEMVSGFNEPQMCATANQIYRALIRIYGPTIPIRITDQKGCDCCRDFPAMVATLPDEMRTKRTEIMLNSIMRIPFQGFSTFSTILDAYGAIFSNEGIYEMSNVVNGLQETFRSLTSYIRLSYMHIGGYDVSELLGEIGQIIKDFLNIYDYMSDTLKEYQMVEYILTCIKFYNITGNKDVTSKDVWNSYPMLCLRDCVSEQLGFLLDVFDKCWTNYFDKDFQRVVDKGYFGIIPEREFIVKKNGEPPTGTSGADRWLEEYSIPAQVSYENLPKISKEDIAAGISEKIGAKVSKDEINFEISEPLLCFYLTEFNRTFPIILGDYGSCFPYIMFYEHRFYILFEITSDANKVYGVTADFNIYGGKTEDEINMTILQFTKSPDHEYIFKYE